MLRKSLLIACLGVAGIASVAQNKINPAGQLLLEEYKMVIQEGEAGDAFRPLEKKEVPVITAIVRLDRASSLDKILADDMEVLSSADNLFIVRMPITRVEIIVKAPEVLSVSFGDKARPMMNYARPSGNVTQVQDGFFHEGSTLKFDGTGVIVGMMDTGLEANHINFKNADGTSRIQRLWHMNSNNGNYVEYTPANMSSFTTDYTTTATGRQPGTHATHVAGILGGSYKGNGTYNSINDPAGGSGLSSTMMNNSPIPFYGVATNADLAFSVGELYHDNILVGVEKIVEYAESQGKTAVINMSLGSTSGPHDGTDDYSDYLSKLGKRAIICMSAGNDGDALISITKKFSGTATGKVLNTFIAESTADGVVDIWSSDNQVLTVKWGLYNKDKQTITYFIESTAQGTASGTGTDFATYFNGSISTVASLNSVNNRYNVYTRLSNVSMKSGNTSMYLVLTVQGTSGQTVYVFGDSGTQFSNKYTATVGLLSGYTPGSASNSINDACCAENILSVGSYNTRAVWGRLDGAVYGYNPTITIGNISSFSSYGTSFQGVQLPYVCAPGAGIVSSYNRYNVNAGGLSGSMVARAANGSDTDYWGNMQGTSMSCPFVTGTIGLWLQADPTLDYDRVMEVINNTSTPVTKDAARWGAGKLDALKGIQYVLANRAAIGTVWEDVDERFVLMPVADGYEGFVAGETNLSVTLHDMQGRAVATARGADGKATVSTSGLARGIYVLSAEGSAGRLTRKVTVR